MEVITLNKEVFLEKCEELSSSIDFQPELVVGILNGGGCIIETIKSKYSGSDFQSVKLKKKNGFINFIKSSKILNQLPYSISNRLRILESTNANKSIKSLNLTELLKYQLDIKFDRFGNKSFKNVLIIDDAIDTGRTMFIVKNNLNKLYPKAAIKTAVISWTLENSVVKPDYYLFKNVLVRFPWSKDYKGKDFEK